MKYTLPSGTMGARKLINGEMTEKYLWADLTTLLAVYDANDNLIQRFEYVDQRMPLSMTDVNGTRYYLHYDQVGTLRAVSDTEHKIIKEVTYDTYGNILEDSNTNFKVPFGFAGGLYDPDTELTRFGYRDYDAYTGKWTAKDPIGFDGTNSCSYYEQRCKETGVKYYCEIAPTWCNRFPIYDDPDPSTDNDYEGWARCTRKCLQDCDNENARDKCK